MNCSDSYQMDSSASRSATSSPSHAKDDTEFTAEEIKFSIRYEEGYNIPDELYQAWLALNHLESTIETSAAASGTQSL